MKQLASMLCGTQGEQVALRDVAIDARVRDLLGEVNVAQTYRNEEKVNIEAVYTFPLPLDAVLLDIEVRIGARVLKGAVMPKKQAQEGYEDAVAGGDAAVMLEAIEPGLYTMNVGNLLPGEEARIAFRYALAYRWSGEALRLMIPTTVAPRYGASPHLPQQAPESSISVENRFSLRVRIEGSLRQAQIACPSHAVQFGAHDDHLLISLQQERAVMDRDFVLNVSAAQGARAFALTGSDTAGVAALASFQPRFPGRREQRPLRLAVVIDCSGSMGGDSIAQARQAIAGMLDALRPQDSINLIAFGDGTRVLARQLVKCDAAGLAQARAFAAELDANMGGTEIEGAMQAAYTALGGVEQGDIFLITDGEVSQWESVVKKARKHGHRVFTVGVGSAVSEAFVRGLAEATGGQCELVSPQEEMAQRVLRHFARMHAPRARRAAIVWPIGARDVTPQVLGAVFEGDTLVASARLEGAAAGSEVVLEIETDTGEVIRQAMPLTAFEAKAPREEGLSTIARLAAAQRLRGHAQRDEAAQGEATALQYRLMSPWTNWLAVAERSAEERAQDLPELRKVPQTLAAGWGGSGSVMLRLASFDMMAGAAPSVSAPAPAAAPAMFERGRSAAPGGAPKKAGLGEAMRKLGKAIRRESPAAEGFAEEAVAPAFEKEPLDPVQALLALLRAEPQRLQAKQAIELLIEAGLAPHFDALFEASARAGLLANALAVIALAEILEAQPAAETAAWQGALASLRGKARELARLMLALAQAPQRDSTLASAQAELLFEPRALTQLRGGAPLPDLRDLLERTRAAARSVAPGATVQA